MQRRLPVGRPPVYRFRPKPVYRFRPKPVTPGEGGTSATNQGADQGATNQGVAPIEGPIESDQSRGRESTSYRLPTPSCSSISTPDPFVFFVFPPSSSHRPFEFPPTPSSSHIHPFHLAE